MQIFSTLHKHLSINSDLDTIYLGDSTLSYGGLEQICDLKLEKLNSKII